MKAMKKLMAVLLVLALALTLIPAAFATSGGTDGGDDGGTTPDYCKITAPTMPETAKGTHSYKVYQIFTGSKAGAGELQDIKWGANGSGTPGTAVPGDKIEGLKGCETDAALVNYVVNELLGSAEPVATLAAGATSGDLLYGYYYVVDVLTPADGAESDAVSRSIIEVSADTVTLAPKADVPKLEKFVKDANDSTDDATTVNEWRKDADHDVGDAVPFLLKATLGTYVEDYKEYYVEFIDTMSAGLTFKEITEVKVGDTTVECGAGKPFTYTVDGQVLKVKCDDVIALGAGSGTVITVEFTATLNDQAVIGSQGNPNEAFLQYSNNPYDDHYGKTPKDTAIVFTYRVIVNKVDSSNQPLVGAGFALYKNIPGHDDADEEGFVLISEILSTDTDAISQFAWDRIDDGIYKLVETQKPGELYNEIDPIVFTVTAGHVNETLESLSGGDLFTGTVSTGELVTDVVNQTGAELPTTGGMGTTLFYVVGSVMVICAGVLLVAKKRMGAID